MLYKFKDRYDNLVQLIAYDDECAWRKLGRYFKAKYGYSADNIQSIYRRVN